MRLVLRPRVRAAWAILRMRHPLLASHVVMQSYDNIKFVYVVLLRAKIFRRSIHFARVASISRYLPKMLWREPTDSSIIEIRTRMVRTHSGILASSHTEVSSYSCSSDRLLPQRPSHFIQRTIILSRRLSHTHTGCSTTHSSFVSRDLHGSIGRAICASHVQ